MSLFHYTDIHAVISILENRALRCTDLRYLNDSTEFHHGVEKFLENLPQAPYGLFHNEATVVASRTYVEEAMRRANEQFANYNDIFVMSLSRSGDLLSQWRGYGAYAIEFNEEVLTREVPSLHQCIYSKHEQDASALSALTDAIKVVSYDFQENGLVGMKGMDATFELYRVAARFKDTGFAEESEARLIVSEVELANVKYRVRGQMLIPYIEVPITLDCIKAIHVGPMPLQNAAVMSMMDFCGKVAGRWQDESANIEYWLPVEVSKIPFRTP